MTGMLYILSRYTTRVLDGQMGVSLLLRLARNGRANDNLL